MIDRFDKVTQLMLEIRPARLELSTCITTLVGAMLDFALVSIVTFHQKKDKNRMQKIEQYQ